MKKTHKEKIAIAKNMITQKLGTGKHGGRRVPNVSIFNNEKWEARFKAIKLRVARKNAAIRRAKEEKRKNAANR